MHKGYKCPIGATTWQCAYSRCTSSCVVHKIHWLQHLTLLRSLCLTSHNRLGSHAFLSLVLLWRISYRNWPSGLLHRPVLPDLALGSKTIFPRSKTSAMIFYGMIPRREGFWLVLHLQLQMTASPYHTLLPSVTTVETSHERRICCAAAEWRMDLVPSQPGGNLVDCKWIFKVKRYSMVLSSATRLG
jgi:hypothetical protein